MSLLAAAVAATAVCTGSWAHLPANMDRNSGEIGFSLSIADDGSYRMEFSDHGKSIGRTERQADGTVKLTDEYGTSVLHGCGSSSPSVDFDDGRTFSLQVTSEDFWDLAMQRGWEPSDDRPPLWKESFPRWVVQNDRDTDGVCTMTLASSGADRFKLIYQRMDLGLRLASVESAYNRPISQLRAGTQEGLTGAHYVFDGDVVVRAGGNRQNRTLTTLPVAPISDIAPVGAMNAKTDEFLDLVSRGSSLAIYADGVRMVSINLSGSAVAVAALKRCLSEAS